MFDFVRRVRPGIVLLVVVLSVLPVVAQQQQSKSATLAGELVKLLDARKLDSIGAKVADPDLFVGALYIPGSQLLVISARYAVPPRMEISLTQRNYRDVYIDLNSASIAESKVFVTDLGANGLQFSRQGNQPFDTVERSGRTFAFDGDWGRARLSRDEYTTAYQMSDEAYARMLEALIAEIKKTS